MTRAVLDASALLALTHGEPGADRVRAAILDDAGISTLNLAEVLSKLVARGATPDEALDASRIARLARLEVTEAVAIAAGLRHGVLRRQGFSLADVVCLETARALGATALTADRAWRDLPDDIEVIR